MNPKRFYGHNKRSETKVKTVGGYASDDPDLATDSEDVEVHQNLRTQENIIIPESDTDENGEVAGNHLVLDDASDDGNDNAQSRIGQQKKWYHRIVFHLLHLTVVNAWLLYRKGCRSCNVNTKDQISLRDFKISVAACLCQEKKGKTKKRGRSNFSSFRPKLM
ncbi:hypothetical protein ANN_08827 [Periplaneta americana]|uniref:PiggyBac transposable element-derived protein domain-containing protein n=1 Tax=Periplaneta americana TaxID=6978 RepID=A0ABQ8T2I3_PERAM|nr:hypothetical protein ANN_08827 [Periplaneta americana]